MSGVSKRKFLYFKLYINNLSKYWSLGADAIDIPSGSDMHTYLSPGNYRCQSATIAKTLTNCPFQSAFTMKVYYSIGSKPSATDYYILQEYTCLDGSERVLVYFEAKNNKWVSHAIAFKDDLGVTEFNGGKSIEIDGTLSGIGKWINSQGFTARWRSVRCDPNNQGYFGSSSFCILWDCSSASYGWCILMSDNSKMVVFGRNVDGWHWYAPSLSEVS